VANLLGFEFPRNFDRPYTARSLQDFWRRWHMTLSRWLRDYLYIPLGGSRGGEARTYVNVMLTMLLGGLWHGASWNFVIWGGLHGAGLSIGRRRRQLRERKGLPPLAEGPGAVAWQRVATFHIVCLGWVFFRSESLGAALSMLWGLLTRWGGAPMVTPAVIAAIAVGIGAQYVPPGPGERLREGFSRVRPLAQGAALAVSLLVITTLGPQGVAPFIYFQF